ncbi:MAG TPA: cation transporter [Clostridiaceae bacterium]|nr:cation transporter [Clostridiaceae bacterium]
MIKYIIRKFIKDYQNVNNVHVRESYGILSGVMGISCNLFLFLLKLFVGLYINSIAVISDAFNNFSDFGSSLITILGAKFSSRPPDRGHPHGHGRYEYIASLVVSFMIFMVGLQIVRSSIDKIINPEDVQLNTLSIIILLVSVSVKIWMFHYNKYISKIINSSVNKAAAYDSLNDAIATGTVLIATTAGKYVDFPMIDGLIGLTISLLIIYTGFKIARDSVNLLLGSSPDPELIEKINTLVLKGKYIKGTHDLKVHDYGPGNIIASIHAEVSDDVNIVDVHSEIDNIEKEIKKELGVNIVIHMDPVE